jgi:hypothetical protein
MEQYHKYGIRNVYYIPPPSQNVISKNNYMSSLSSMDTFVINIQTPNIPSIPNNNNINYLTNNPSYSNSNFTKK